MTARGNAVIWLAVAGAAAVWATSGGEARAAEGEEENVADLPGLDDDLLRRAAYRVAEFEGRKRFDAINANTDGAGLSFGFKQDTQKSGNLGVLCKAMRRSDPLTFDAVVGSSALANELIRVLSKPSLEPVAGRVLWDPWWTSKFVALGRHPPYQAVQLDVAIHGSHMKAAIKVCQLLTLNSERGVTLAFDRCVQQGEYGTPEMAASLRRAWPSPWPSYPDRMKAFGDAAMAKKKYRSDVVRRVRELLADPNLSDDPIDLTSPTPRARTSDAVS